MYVVRLTPRGDARVAQTAGGPLHRVRKASLPGCTRHSLQGSLIRAEFSVLATGSAGRSSRTFIGKLRGRIRTHGASPSPSPYLNSPPLKGYLRVRSLKFWFLLRILLWRARL